MLHFSSNCRRSTNSTIVAYSPRGIDDRNQPFGKIATMNPVAAVHSSRWAIVRRKGAIILASAAADDCSEFEIVAGMRLVSGCYRLIQEILLLQPLRDVFLGDVADVLADEGLDFQLEAVLQHPFDFFLPGLLLLEPRIAGDLLGPFD